MTDPDEPALAPRAPKRRTLRLLDPAGGGGPFRSHLLGGIENPVQVIEVEPDPAALLAVAKARALPFDLFQASVTPWACHWAAPAVSGACPEDGLIIDPPMGLSTRSEIPRHPGMQDPGRIPFAGGPSLERGHP